jgi:hypothetical protein
VQTKNGYEIGVGDVVIPRKGVGYFLRVSGDPFPCESDFRPDQYLCQFSLSGVVKTGLVHPAVGCYAVVLLCC